MAASGGAAALAVRLGEQAMDIAAAELESLELAGETSVPDMERIRAWGARMYLLGLGDRAAAPRSAPVRRDRSREAPRRRSDGGEVSAACKASGHRTPGGDGRCACRKYALDDVIAKEMCACGHVRGQHSHGRGGAAGHGKCEALRCDCNQYTWVSNGSLGKRGG